MKKYKVHWTYQVVSVPVEHDWEHEVFVTFHPRPVEGSKPLPLSKEEVSKFFPDLILPSYEAYETRLEETICDVLNLDPNDFGDLICPLEDQAYNEWKKGIAAENGCQNQRC